MRRDGRPGAETAIDGQSASQSPNPILHPVDPKMLFSRICAERGVETLSIVLDHDADRRVSEDCDDVDYGRRGMPLGVDHGLLSDQNEIAGDRRWDIPLDAINMNDDPRGIPILQPGGQRLQGCHERPPFQGHGSHSPDGSAQLIDGMLHHLLSNG